MPRIIDLPKFEDPRGNLSFIEENNHIPFKTERAYWIYDVAANGKLRYQQPGPVAELNTLQRRRLHSRL